MTKDTYRIVLASRSPRRSELLRMLGLDFEIMPSDGPEIITKTEPDRIVEELSEAKARAVFEKIKNDKKDDKPLLLIGADTIVCLDSRVLGKPKDEEDAFSMLKSLSGRMHEVYTGVTLICSMGSETLVSVFSDRTEVFFEELTDEEIRSYIRTGDPMDKAGAYGIQGEGGKFIRGIRGDFYNVMGLPVPALYRKIKELGL